MANKYLFANLLLFASGEGDEATSPSFTTSYADPSFQPIAGNAHFSLVRSVGMKSEPFTHGKQMPICQSFTFCERRGRRGNVALFYNKLRADPSFQPIAGNAHFSLVRSVGMEKRALYQWQTNDCLPIFYFLRAKRATRQRRPLLQQVTRRSKLLAHRWKRSFQLGTFSGDEKASTLPNDKQMLVCQSFTFCERRGRRGNVALFYNKLRVDPSF